MLNKSSQLEVLNMLKNASSTFSLDDFDVDFYNNHSKVTIKFKHEPEYHFNVKYEERHTYTTVVNSNHLLPWEKQTETKTKVLNSKYDIRVCPGEDSINETWHILAFMDLKGCIYQWVKYLENELTIDNINDEKEKETTIQKEKLKSTLHLHFESYIDNKTERFNNIEISEINEKLNKLVESLERDNILLLEEIERLKNIISEASKNLTRFKKGTWFEITTNKFATWATGIENTQRLIDSVKQLPFF